MKAWKKSVFIILIFLSVATLVYAQNISELVDQFKEATDLQRAQMIKDYFGKEMTTGGVVTNVEEYNFFNEPKDLVNKYYRVMTGIQKTAKDTAYQVIFLSKDLEKVKDFAKGQNIEKQGKIVKIIDERLEVAVWLYDGELSPQEKETFQQ